jgi:hypothetical protein
MLLLLKATLVVPTPASRTYTVGAADRTYTVEA